MKSAIVSCAIIVTLSFCAVRPVYPDSATWNLNPTSGDWGTATNWTPNTVPDGPTDTATFGASNVTHLSVGTLIELDAMIFQPGASPYSFTIFRRNSSFSFSGAGVINNSGQVQAFILDSHDHLIFTNSATAGNQTTIKGGGGLDGIVFHDNSSAGSSTFTVADCIIYFYENSTAGDAAFTVGGVDQRFSGYNEIIFHDESSAGNGYFVLNAATSIDSENAGLVRY